MRVLKISVNGCLYYISQEASKGYIDKILTKFYQVAIEVVDMPAVEYKQLDGARKLANVFPTWD